MTKMEVLQDIQIKNDHQEKEYFLNDGRGLRLLVKANGSSDYINQLIPLMNFWSNFIIELKNGTYNEKN